MAASPILGPVITLIGWTLIMMVWMYVTRYPAMKRHGITLNGMVGTRGNALDGVVEDRVQWKTHNYNNLMEQPTLFYAIALILALMDHGGGINLILAWGYVALRIVHSLVQAISNVVRIRFYLFLAASACLLGLTIHAGAHFLHSA